MFDVRRARGLRAVEQYGSVTAAAAVLHVTSSALSQQLAKLEREIGQPLLVSRGRGVALTDAGRLLADHTGRILDQIAIAEAELEAARGVATGRMSIGAFATFTRAALPAVLRDLKRGHPHLRIESHEYEPAVALAMLTRGEIDIAVIDEWFLPAPALPEGLRHRQLGTDTADLAVPAGHALAGAAEPVVLAACAGYDWISWRAGEYGNNWLRHALAVAPANPPIAHTAGEHHTILALVDAGLGIALMPRLGRGAVPAGVFIKSVTPAITRRYFAVWRAQDQKRPAVMATLDILTANTGERKEWVTPDR